MIKRLFQAIIIAFILSIAVTGFAAPDEMAADDKGNATDLIILNNPAGEEIVTFEKSYILSGSGQEGIIVTLYVYSSADNKYKKIFIQEDGKLKPVEWQIGESGQFMNEIELSDGNNKFALRAEKDENTYQVEKLNITFKKGFLNTIKDLTIDFKDIKNFIDNIKK